MPPPARTHPRDLLPGRPALPDASAAGAERSNGCPPGVRRQRASRRAPGTPAAGIAAPAEPSEGCAGAPGPGRALERYLHTLFARDDPSALVAVRFGRPGDMMRQRFYAIERRAPLANTPRWLAREHPVYVAAAPRVRRGGDRNAVQHGWVLWADCDTPAATLALERFTPAPTMTIASGTIGHVHAYRALDTPLAPDGSSASTSASCTPSAPTRAP